ncbi:MAG: hypothetical protein HGA45_19610, partial [Chloroflexales bacterium]|nr:hypothetical protein [Chloroflexales bacterium]
MLALSLPIWAGAQGVQPGPHIAQGQGRLSFRTIGVAQGLPHHGVYGIVQDRYGFMWFATLDGLARFDGQAFEVYRADPANPNAPSSSVNWELYADREGVIWSGTLNSGLVRYDPRTERFTHLEHDPADPASLSDDAVRAIYQDGAGALWVGTLSGGLNRLDPAAGRFTRYQHDPANPNSLSNDRVEAIVDDGAGGLWVATYGGLDRLDPATGRFAHYRQDPNDPAGLGRHAINALLHDRAGNLWIGVDEGGLYRLDKGGKHLDAYHYDPADPSSLSSDNVTTIAEDSAGTVWVGTYGGGLNRFEAASGTFTHYRRTLPPEEGLASNNIMSLFPGKDGLLWVGTEERGVTLIDQQAKPFHIVWGDPGTPPSSDRLRSGFIRSVIEDRDGAIWVGFSDMGLDRFDRERGRVTHFRSDPSDPGSPISNRPQVMLVDRDGTLWIGYFGGLDRFDRAGNRFVHYRHDPADPRSLGHNNIFALCEDRDGGLWIATRGGGIDRLDRASGTFTHYRHDPADPSSLSSDSILAIAEDQRGALWIGTEDGGLNRLDRASGAFTRYRHNPTDPGSLSSNTVAVLFVDRGGALWAATWDSGLDRFDPASDSFVHYRPNDGVPNSKINGINGDSAGNLWLSSNLGLMKLDPRSGATMSFTNESAGLPPGGFPLNSSAIGRSGEILLGAADSLVTFFPEQISARVETPVVVITRFLLKNEPVTIGGASALATSINETSDLTLSYYDQVIRFEFAALDYRAPQAMRYRYRLEGFDQGWIETSSERRAATYTNLDPGSYVFRVRARNGDGVWGQAERSIRITITPPWWKAWWFLMLATVAVAATSIGAVYQRLSRMYGQQRRLEIEAAARTSELTAANASLAVEVAERSRAEQAVRAAHDDLERQLTIERELIMSHNLDTLLGRILEQIGQAVDFVTAGIFTADGEELVLRAIRSNYLQPRAHPIRLTLERVPPLSQAMDSGRVHVLANPG